MQAYIADESSEVLVDLRAFAEMPQLAKYIGRETLRTCHDLASFAQDPKKHRNIHCNYQGSLPLWVTKAKLCDPDLPGLFSNINKGSLYKWYLQMLLGSPNISTTSELYIAQKTVGMTVTVALGNRSSHQSTDKYLSKHKYQLPPWWRFSQDFKVKVSLYI